MKGPVPDNDKVESLRRNTGECPSTFVIQSVVLAIQSRNIRRNDAVLVAGSCEVVRKAASANVRGLRIVDNYLRKVSSAANGSGIWTRSWKYWKESGCILSVIAVARAIGPDAVIAGREQEANTTSTELCKQTTDSSRIGAGHRLFVVAVGCADDLWKRRLSKCKIGPFKVGLVGIVQCMY